MIKKVEMYTVACDHCKKDIGSEQDYSCWNDDTYAEQNAMESDWIKDGIDHYCTDCYSYDDNDVFVLDESRKNKHLSK